MLLALAATAAFVGAGAPAASAAEPQEVLVRFAKSAGAGDRETVREVAGTKLEEVLPVRGLQLVDPEPGVSVAQAIARLERSDDVLYAEPDRVRSALAAPNDQHFNILWGMHNTGQNVDGVTGTPDADIDAPEAWDIATGSAAITVGVLDSGVDVSHPDLASNIWTNPGETANGSDDDGNGLVDDVNGWDWVGNDATANDTNGHGTHVSGTVGARGNDSTGVAGVSWDVGLVPLRVLDASGNGTISNLVKGYDYARVKGLRVVNASLGSDGFSQSERDAIAAAPDTLFVVAAGNGGDDGVADDNDASPIYPCNYDLPNIVCVAATDSDDVLAPFSNYGATSVDLAAPGVLTGSTWPGAVAPCSGPPCWIYLDGTSMATPHVAGTAALVMARDPAASVTGVKAALLGSVDVKPGLAGKTLTGGRLNAFGAVSAGGFDSGSGGTPSGGGTPAAAPAPASPVAPAPAPTVVDRLAPSLGIVFPRVARKRTTLRRGLVVRVRCSEACNVRADLLADSRSLRAARRVVVGITRASMSRSGTVRLRIRFRAKARRALARRRSVRLKLRIRAADRRGNARTVIRSVTLR